MKNRTWILIGLVLLVAMVVYYKTFRESEAFKPMDSTGTHHEGVPSGFSDSQRNRKEIPKH